MDTPGTAIIVSPFARTDLLPSQPDMRPVASWPLDTEEGRAKMHSIIAGQSETLWDWCERGPVEIRVTDLAAHFSSWEPEDRPGELIAGPMLSLVGPDGVFHTGSPHVYESIRQLIMLDGPPPWKPAIRLAVSRVATRQKRQRMCVVYVGRADSTA